MLNSSYASFIKGGVLPDWLTLIDQPDTVGQVHTLEMFLFSSYMPSVLFFSFYPAIDGMGGTPGPTMTYWNLLNGEVDITRNLSASTIVTPVAGASENPRHPVECTTVADLVVFGYWGNHVAWNRGFQLGAGYPLVAYKIDLRSDGGTVQGRRNYNDVDDNQYRAVMIPGDEYTAEMQDNNNTFTGTLDGGADTTFRIVGIYRLHVA